MSSKQLIFGLLILSLSCGRKTTTNNLLGTKLDSCDYVDNVVSANSLFVGRWRLVRIKANSWGITSDKPPAKPVEMVASPQGQLTLYEADEAIWSGRLLLTQPYPKVVRYVVVASPNVDYTTKKTLSRPVSSYIPPDRSFRICTNHLLISDSDLDGPDMYWLRLNAR